MEPTHEPQQPGPSLWPIGFAIGLACVLVGLIVSWPVVVVGAVIAALCAAMWIRDATRGHAEGAVEEPREAAAGPAAPAEEEDVERYGRNVFLSGATIGLGGAIAGIVTVPAVGFMIAPAFVGQKQKDIDLGPLDKFPEGQWVIVNFFRNPDEGAVARRTAYVRNNGVVNGSASFTIISNRCAHLGCPVQPNGPVNEDQRSVANFGKENEVSITPMQPAGFGCPCHGGQYDTEGNRTAGPPVRALDRYDFAIRSGRLVLLGTYSVGGVVGEGAGAKIKRYNLQGPGQPVEGVESWLYPLQSPH